jgi:Ca-activated chloride channel family protein
MNHKEAEKLLSALIFGDLDEASRNELTAYLRTDDELREQLADMRMAVKVTSDALQHGPDPVLSKKRLKRLARLAKSTSRRPVIFSVRSMAAAAAILIVITLSIFIFMPSLHKAQMLSLRPGIDLAGGSNSKFDIEFTGGTSVKIGAKAEQKPDPETLRRLESLGHVERGIAKGYGYDKLAYADEIAADAGRVEFLKAKEVAKIVDEINAEFGGTRLSEAGKSNSGVYVDGYGDTGGDSYVGDSLGGRSGNGRGGMGAYGRDNRGKGRQNGLFKDGHAASGRDGEEIAGKTTEKFGGGFYKGSMTFSDSTRPVANAPDDFANESVIVMQNESSPTKPVSSKISGPDGKEKYYTYDKASESNFAIRTDETSAPTKEERTVNLETRDSIYAGNRVHGPRLANRPPTSRKPRKRTSAMEKPATVKTPQPQNFVPRHAKVAPDSGSITYHWSSKPDVSAKDNWSDSKPNSMKSRPEGRFAKYRGHEETSITSESEIRSAPKLRPRGQIEGVLGTKAEDIGSITNMTMGSFLAAEVAEKIKSNGKKLDRVMYDAKEAPASRINKPSTVTSNWKRISSRRKKTEDLEPKPHQPEESYVPKSGGSIIQLDKDASPTISNCTLSVDDVQAAIDTATDGDKVLLCKKITVLGDAPIVGALFKVEKRIVGAEDADSDGAFVEWSGQETLDCKVDLSSFGADREEGERYANVAAFDAPVGNDEIDLPLASGFKAGPVNPWVMSNRDRLSTFGLDVDTASYTLCRRYIYNGFLPPAGAVRMEEFINYFNYHYPQRSGRTFTVHAEAAPSPFADKGKNLTLLKIGVKARTIGRDQQKAAHLILVIDTSASMGKPDRLPLIQQSLNLLIDKLSPADRITLITCSNESRLHLEATSLQHRDRIRKAINALQPSGSTNLLAGLKLGYAMARRSFAPKQINHVVLCSDGVANVGQTESELVLKEVDEDRKQGITITCVGVGFGSYNDVFMESLANRGDGSYVFLDSARQGQKVFVDQLAATLHTVAKDARIQVKFNPDRVRRYRLIGYENRDIEDKRFRDDTVDAGEVGSGQCSTALYELELTGHRSSDRGQGLGTVFVRYRNADTGQMEEISYSLKNSIVRRRKIETSPRFFLAAAASRFAEILRQSEHARHASLTDVLAVAEKVTLALPLDRDVRELTELIRRSEHLPRAQ